MPGLHQRAQTVRMTPIEKARAQFDRLVLRRTVTDAVGEYDDVRADMEDLVRRASPKGKTLTRTEKIALAAAMLALGHELAERLSQSLHKTVFEARADALRATGQFVFHYENRPPRMLRPAEFGRVLQQNTQAVRQMITQQTVATTGAVIGKVRAAIQAHKEGDPVRAISQVTDQGESAIVRLAATEGAIAYNEAIVDGIHALSNEFPDLMMRWTEHVSDATWRPTDKKTAADSIALHGQVAGPGEPFTMPLGGPMFPGGQWYSPPNRPHDRAILVPWRKAWGIPAWTYRGSVKRWLVPR